MQRALYVMIQSFLIHKQSTEEAAVHSLRIMTSVMISFPCWFSVVLEPRGFPGLRHEFWRAHMFWRPIGYILKGTSTGDHFPETFPETESLSRRRI